MKQRYIAFIKKKKSRRSIIACAVGSFLKFTVKIPMGNSRETESDRFENFSGDFVRIANNFSKDRGDFVFICAVVGNNRDALLNICGNG